jgi:molecular chaperone DnaJ
VPALAVDYYALLGVPSDASEDEIKRAYRRMARELHPDSTGGDIAAEARFKEVSQAYEVLRDPDRRARYDRYGSDQADTIDPFFGSGLGGIFDAFFGGAMDGGARRSGPVRGADAQVMLELTLPEAVFGAERDVTIEVPVTCETCGGSGARKGTTALPCPECDGVGELRRVRQSILGQVMTTAPCRRCQATGEVIPTPCPDCRGEGRRVETRTYPVAVPAGVAHGSTMRMSGRGPAGRRSGPAGDLFVHLSVTEDERFTREGDDLHAQVHVSMIQAALGATVAFSTLDGDEQLQIAAGTQNRHVIRLRGRGVPHVRGRGRGDLEVEVVVDTPTGLTKAQQEMLRRMAAERGEQISPPDEGIMARLRSTLG